MAPPSLWEIVRDKRIGGSEFRRQHSIGSYIVDFYCHAASLVIEVDGPIHMGKQVEDAERTDWLSSAGLKVVRFSNREVVENPDLVKQKLQYELAARMKGAF